MLGQGNDLTAHLRIDGGEALSTLLVARVNEACDQAEDSQKAIFVIHLHGVESDARGGDEAWLGRGIGICAINRWERALRRVERLCRMTVCVVEGICWGPAVEVLLATDYRIASADARLRLPISENGTWPGMAVFRAVQQLGLAKARELVLLGSEVSASRAVDLGLVNEMTDDLPAAVGTAIRRWEGIPGKEIAIRRELLFDALTESFDAAVGTHLAACDRTMRRG